MREIVAKTPATLTAPLVKARKGYHKEVAAWIKREGYRELIVDGERYEIDEFPTLERYREHTIDVVIAELDDPDAKGDATAGKKGVANRKRVRLSIAGKTSIETRARAVPVGGNGGQPDSAVNRVVLSSEMTCPNCGDAFEELDPRLFSFNSPHGWCPICNGFGYILAVYYRR